MSTDFTVSTRLYSGFDGVHSSCQSITRLLCLSRWLRTARVLELGPLNPPWANPLNMSLYVRPWTFSVRCSKHRVYSLLPPTPFISNKVSWLAQRYGVGDALCSNGYLPTWVYESYLNYRYLVGTVERDFKGGGMNSLLYFQDLYTYCLFTFTNAIVLMSLL